MEAIETHQEPSIGNHIGGTLSALRKSAGLTGQSCAQKAHVSLRTLIKIEQGDPTVSLGRYLAVAAILNATWLFEVFADPQEKPAQNPPTRYLSGLSALCLPGRYNLPALWYSSSLQSVNQWQVTGRSLVTTNHLIGGCGLYNAANHLHDFGVGAAFVWAANHERALFDHLHHFCEAKGRPVPNIQVSDLDDVVSVETVQGWLHQCRAFVSEEGFVRAMRWLDG